MFVLNGAKYGTLPFSNVLNVSNPAISGLLDVITMLDPGDFPLLEISKGAFDGFRGIVYMNGRFRWLQTIQENAMRNAKYGSAIFDDVASLVSIEREAFLGFPMYPTHQLHEVRLGYSTLRHGHGAGLRNTYIYGDSGSCSGTCTCPDEEEFLVGDNHDTCKTLACYGGTSGPCSCEIRRPRGQRMVASCAMKSPEKVNQTEVTLPLTGCPRLESIGLLAFARIAGVSDVGLSTVTFECGSVPSLRSIGYDAFARASRYYHSCTGNRTGMVAMHPGVVNAPRRECSLNIKSAVTLEQIGHSVFANVSTAGFVEASYGALNHIGPEAFFKAGNVIDFGDLFTLETGSYEQQYLSGGHVTMYPDFHFDVHIESQNELTSVGTAAFLGVHGLITIVGGFNALTMVQCDAFANTSGIVVITAAPNLAVIGERAFFNFGAVSFGGRSTGHTCTLGRTQLINVGCRGVTLVSGLTLVDAFKGFYSSVQSVPLSFHQLTHIGGHAFAGASATVVLDMPKLQSLGIHAFDLGQGDVRIAWTSNTTAISSVDVLPSDDSVVITIGDFLYAKALTNEVSCTNRRREDAIRILDLSILLASCACADVRANCDIDNETIADSG